MNFTRDSWLWWFGMIASVITAAAMNLNLLPTILEPYKEWITFVSVIIAATSGKMATSPLKGEND